MLEAPVRPKESNGYVFPLPMRPKGENGKQWESLSPFFEPLFEKKIEELLVHFRQKQTREEEVNRQHLFLEAAIVGLIVVEVVLFCYELFWKG